MSLQDSPEIDVDSLLAEINAPTPEREMTGGETEQATPEATQKTAPAATPTPPQTIQEYEFDWQGRKIKAPIDRITKWASQGYDYSQKIEAFKKQQQDFASQRQSYDKYKQIDDYVKKDPQWWKFVEEQYNNRLTSEDPVVQRVKGLLDEKLAPYEAFLAQKEQLETQNRIEKEDTQLASEIKSIREKYSDLDFETPDSSGKSLEFKVLEHGAKNQFPSFRSAFLDFYHDQLEKRWQSQGKTAVMQETQKRQKLGLSASKPTPKQDMSESFEVTGKSYNQIQQELFKRLGL